MASAQRPELEPQKALTLAEYPERVQHGLVDLDILLALREVDVVGGTLARSLRAFM